mmetsp:Transcript_67971/g.198900  ORF Transcript_67971/g.198900 Transcript_67971/m.198900 type:complete len:625 (+) Transcript_67971:85-1959(+)
MTKKAAAGGKAAKEAAAVKKGGGLSKFFASKPGKEEAKEEAGAEAPAKASVAPANPLSKLFAAQAKPTSPAQAAPPAQAAAPAAAAAKEAPSPSSATSPSSTAASPEKGKPQLSEEQVARIEENRRKAREKQQAKRAREDVDQPSEQQTPSPPRASARPAAAAEAAVTPEKVQQPHERRQSPAPGLAGEAGGAAAGRFAGGCKAWMQYNNLYAIRLKHLRTRALQEAQSVWGGALAPESFLPEITGYRKFSEVALVGVLFKELKGRPNVIEQYKNAKVGAVLGLGGEADALQRLSTDDDVLWLEDSSMRLQLVASAEQVAGLPTGAVVAVRGAATAGGHLQLAGVCFPRMASPPPLPAPAAGPFLALASGLAFGESGGGLAEARSRALAFLLGEGCTGEAVRRLIVCGGTFAPVEGGSVSKAALQEADEAFSRLANSFRVDVMPGRGDPTNLTLPQMPLHPHLFKSVRKCRDFKPVTNPYECSIDGVSVLGHAGQPVDDLLRCTSLASPLEALTLCLRASHIAPTAPDTLPTQPFSGADPFVLDELPHVFFSGGHAEASHQWHPSDRGVGGSLCACVPAFREKPAVILVNLTDPRDVRVREFGEASAAADVQMGMAEEASVAAA